MNTNLHLFHIAAATPAAAAARKPRQSRARVPARGRNKAKAGAIEAELSPDEMLVTDNAIDEPMHSGMASASDQIFHGNSQIGGNLMALMHSTQQMEQTVALLGTPSPRDNRPATPLEPTLEMLESGNSNSSTTSNGSISMDVKRSRKSVTSSSNKPSLRSTTPKTGK